MIGLGYIIGQKRKRGRTTPNIERNRERGHALLFSDYFGPNPTYTQKHFKRRFRISFKMYDVISEALISEGSYFVQKPDATGRLGASTLQKILTAMSLLGHGIAFWIRIWD